MSKAPEQEFCRLEYSKERIVTLCGVEVAYGDGAEWRYCPYCGKWMIGNLR